MKKPLRILHLEDEPFDSELVQDLLAHSDLVVEIDRVDTMESFTAALHNTCYPLILADYKVPGVDPVEVLRWARHACPETPFIFLSGTIGEEKAIQILKLGASDCVSKQSPGRLVPAIRRAFHDFEEKAIRKKAEEKMRLQSSALQAAANSIVIVNREGTIEWVNAAFEHLTGYSAAEAIGQNPRLLKSGKHPPEFYKAMWGKIATGQVWRSEIINKRKDGTVYHEEMTITPVRNAEGEITHFIAIKQDVTERMQREQELCDAREQLTHYNAELENKVQERTAKLNETIGELEAFSYSLSHDMRAPLRAISGYIQILLTEHQQGLSNEAITLIERVDRASSRMDQLITDVLALTRIAHVEIRAEPIDVEKLLRQLIEERPEFQPPNADIIIQSPLAHAFGDSASLCQCLTNLLGNAIKYIAPGIKPQIRIWTEERNERGPLNPIVRLWVADNGIGIEQEAQNKIFKMFQRLPNTGEYEGTGVGLAIVRKAVQRMGGHAGVESKPGKGSQFWLDLKKAVPSVVPPPSGQ